MRSVFAALGGLVVLFAAASLQAQEKPKEVAPQETIQFEQDKAQAHMRELEQRMFRLAELIRDAQPEDAARLKLGVERARDTLIADRMSQASQLLVDSQAGTGRDGPERNHRRARGAQAAAAVDRHRPAAQARTAQEAEGRPRPDRSPRPQGKGSAQRHEGRHRGQAQ